MSLDGMKAALAEAERAAFLGQERAKEATKRVEEEAAVLRELGLDPQDNLDAQLVSLAAKAQRAGDKALTALATLMKAVEDAS